MKTDIVEIRMPDGSHEIRTAEEWIQFFDDDKNLNVTMTVPPNIFIHIERLYEEGEQDD